MKPLTLFFFTELISRKVKPFNKSVVLRFSPWASLKELLKQNLQFYVYYGFNVQQNQVDMFLSTDKSLTGQKKKIKWARCSLFRAL